MPNVKLRRLKNCLIVIVVLGALGALFGWYKFFREIPQAPFANDEMRFKYGSFGVENDAGIPYWIWVVLPRIFPEYLPGPGGYRSLVMVWEQGEELPVGFTKKTVGFPRVGNNCAACHAASYRTKHDEIPKVVAAGPSHTSNVQGFLRFLSKCAQDPRFNASEILSEIALLYDLPWLDKLLYRFIIIPFTKKALTERGGQFDWMNRPGWPDWGPGRDDPMNLTKYFMTHLPVDNTIGNTDFPAIWNLGVRDGKPLQWDGSTPIARAVIIDSALGMQARNTNEFMKHMNWLEGWLKALPPPKYPLEIDQKLAAAGKTVFDFQCGSCHAWGQGPRAGTLIDIKEIGTDRERLDSWTKEGADKANEVRTRMGVNIANMLKTNGYVAVPLHGLWLRGPYLHNGSVPTVRDLLARPERRPGIFYRGYDVLDIKNLGFISQGPEAEQAGYRFDTNQRGNSNRGHLYGVDLSPSEKDALIEYLKTL
jgi:hypothetical protein